MRATTHLQSPGSPYAFLAYPPSDFTPCELGARRKRPTMVAVHLPPHAPAIWHRLEGCIPEAVLFSFSR